MMRLLKLTIWRSRAALTTLAACTAAAGCGGSGPAADTTLGAAPVASESVPPVAIPPASAGPTRPAASPGTAAHDTVRGIVSEVGSRPMTSVVVRPAAGGAVRITGDLAAEIARAAGAEVWVSGDRGPQGLEARAYAVRTVDGEAAIDGVLARDGERLVLLTPAGNRPIARPLQAFGGMIGARVWLVGPLDGTITSYGILREP